MPQVKGQGSWLVNMRQDTEKSKYTGIDNSEVRIENDIVEENMRRELDEIHLQAHRTMADRDFELSQAKKEASDYQRIKELANKKPINALMEKRRLEKTALYGDNGEIITNTNGKSIRPFTAAVCDRSSSRPQSRKPPGRGFSHVDVDDSDDDDHYYRKLQNATTSSTTVLMPTTTAHPRRNRRRPRTSHPARSIRQIRQALEDEFSSLPKKNKRPNTTLGIPSRTNEGGDGKSNGEGGASPGRSFQALKDIAHIDRLSQAQLKQRHALIMEVKADKMRDEAKQLQEKLNKFYDRLDRFKRDSNKSWMNNSVLY